MQSYSCVHDRCEQTDGTLFPVLKPQHEWDLCVLPDEDISMWVLSTLSASPCFIDQIRINLFCDTAVILIHLFIMIHLYYSSISPKYVSPNASPAHRNSLAHFEQAIQNMGSTLIVGVIPEYIR